MNWVDIVLVLFLILTAVIGLKRGLIDTAIPLAGLIAGVAVAGHHYASLAHTVFRSEATLAYMGAFALIVVIFLLAAAIIATILHDFVSLVLLDWLNHLSGLALGVVLGGVAAGAILALLLKYSIAAPSIEDSSVASLLVDKLPLALFVLPGNFDSARRFFH